MIPDSFCQIKVKGGMKGPRHAAGRATQTRKLMKITGTEGGGRRIDDENK